MNTVEKVGNQLHCGCGAKAIEPKDHKRFLTRHPAKCNEKLGNKEFTKKLAGGTKSVGTSQEENVDLYRLEIIEGSGRGLTEWEIKFIKDIRAGIDKNGRSTHFLTPKMKESLEKIYVDRTP